MTYNDLMKKYRSNEVFIYGRSVMQIVDTVTYQEEGITKTDFVFKTDRNRRGIITKAHFDEEVDPLPI
jgi:hypothetical protein